MPRGPIVLLCAAAAGIAAVWLLADRDPPVPSGGDGSLQEQHPLRPGEAAKSTGAPAGDRDPMVGEPGPHEVAAQPLYVRGFIVDENGAPLPDVVVVCVDGAAARSDAGGWFVISGRNTEADRAQLLFTAAGRSPQTRTVAWGATGERVSLAPAGLLAVSVVDAATNVPIESYAVQLVGAVEPALRADPVVLQGPHPGGLVEARVAIEPRALLRVVAADERYAPSALHLVELDAASPAVVRCGLQRWRDRPIDVFEASGSPLAGAQVEVLALPPGLRCAPETLAVTDWRQFAPQRAASLFVARTDAAGHRVVRAPEAGSFVLRVTPPDGASVIVADASSRIADGQPLRVQLPR